ncbi:50S ribosomal protein L22 [Patescibacteria group bacterium]|nr:50S ribosomal protein L22 [Patescibacteria group bacterium]MBU4453062.1 50S ribosomal protein L22 [Patescibacteria group bacterium]MCG2687561.1 50S ribosomal protein L22 [Candidatus Parcubacteria bacterium]
MEAQAIAKFVHMSPRKVRLVADLVRNLSVDQAVKQLTVCQKAAATPVLKVLNSAVANAGGKENIDPANTYLVDVFVDGGPVIKRFFPRAHGRSSLIMKRTSHISIKIGTKEEKVTQDK